MPPEISSDAYRSGFRLSVFAHWLRKIPQELRENPTTIAVELP